MQQKIIKKNEHIVFVVLFCMGCTASDWLKQQDDVNQICFLPTGKGLGCFLSPGRLLCCLRLFTLPSRTHSDNICYKI